MCGRKGTDGVHPAPSAVLRRGTSFRGAAASGQVELACMIAVGRRFSRYRGSRYLNRSVQSTCEVFFNVPCLSSKLMTAKSDPFLHLCFFFFHFCFLSYFIFLILFIFCFFHFRFLVSFFILPFFTYIRFFK